MDLILFSKWAIHYLLTLYDREIVINCYTYGLNKVKKIIFLFLKRNQEKTDVSRDRPIGQFKLLSIKLVQKVVLS